MNGTVVYLAARVGPMDAMRRFVRLQQNKVIERAEILKEQALITDQAFHGIPFSDGRPREADSPSDSPWPGDAA